MKCKKRRKRVTFGKGVIIIILIFHIYIAQINIQEDMINLCVLGTQFMYIWVLGCGPDMVRNSR